MFYGTKIVSIGFTSKKKIDCIIYTSPTLLKGGRTGRDFGSVEKPGGLSVII